VGAVLESPPGLREIVARLAECQVKVVSTDPAALVPAELAVLSAQLADLEKQLRAWAWSQRQRPASTRRRCARCSRWPARIWRPS